MRMSLVLPTLFAGNLLLGAAASAQAVPTAWDLIVTVRKDRVGADLVSVGPRASGYPAELLRRQMIALGDRLGRGGARGVTVQSEEIRPGDASETVLRGRCGVDGLIDATTGSLDLAPIAQAFAGAPAPYTVHRMLVSFDGVTIRPGHTLAYHTVGRDSDLAFVGRSVGSSVEYDVEMRSQDPARLVVHEAEAAARSAVPTARPTPPHVDAPTVALFALAAVAAGALVYCGLLLLGRRPVTKS